MNVVKRDGTIQAFDFNKIQTAVQKAFDAVNEEMDDKFLNQLKNSVDVKIKHTHPDESINIEDIQDIIQKELIKRNKYNVVNAFIVYRKRHEEIREEKSDLIKEFDRKLAGKHNQRQNANIDEDSFGGRVGEAADVICKQRALKKMPSKMRKNHEENRSYVHDLNAYMDGRHNCLTFPIDKCLREGFKTRQTDVRPANSINTAMQLVAVLFQLQSLNQFGGVSASHLDFSMVPYVRKSFWKHFEDGLKYVEGLSQEEIKAFKKELDIEK